MADRPTKLWTRSLVLALAGVALVACDPPELSRADKQGRVACAKQWNEWMRGHGGGEDLVPRIAIVGEPQAGVSMRDGECALVITFRRSSDRAQLAMLFLRKGDGFERYANYPPEDLPNPDNATLKRDGMLVPR